MSLFYGFFNVHEKKKQIKLINFLLSGKAEKNSLLAFFP